MPFMRPSGPTASIANVPLRGIGSDREGQDDVLFATYRGFPVVETCPIYSQRFTGIVENAVRLRLESFLIA
jgi:hypothetical protein